MERVKCENLHNINGRWFCDARCQYIFNVKYCLACQKCTDCVNKATFICFDCIDNIKYAKIPTKSHYQPYVPACPFGYMYCINDPAYIKCYDPEWYEELYGDLEPKEVVSEDVHECYHYAHDERYDYCPHYDDEDK